ncbi:MAG: YciI family protein [Thermoanaerobaculia bacterium]|nr:YciI family protein [Thermoanaerobaculia bacterium]
MADYMLFLYDNPEDFAQFSPEEIQAIIAKYGAWAEDLEKRGKLLGGDKLTDGEGRVLRNAGGSVRLTDGPFSETKEILGGYFKIQAESYDEAVAIARTCPHLEFEATVEIRRTDLT